MVLASRSEARSKKGLFDAGGVIASLPLSMSQSFAILKWCEICALSHAIDGPDLLSDKDRPCPHWSTFETDQEIR
jgi:hypothetical protein